MKTILFFLKVVDIKINNLPAHDILWLNDIVKKKNVHLMMKI